jgi:hypothetical protein
MPALARVAPLKNNQPAHCRRTRSVVFYSYWLASPRWLAASGMSRAGHGDRFGAFDPASN